MIKTLTIMSDGKDLSDSYKVLLAIDKKLKLKLEDENKIIKMVITSEEDLLSLSEFIFSDFIYNMCDKVISGYYIDKNYINKLDDGAMDLEDLKKDRSFLIVTSVKCAIDDTHFKKELLEDVFNKLKNHIEDFDILDLEGFYKFRLKEYKYYFLRLISRAYDVMLEQKLRALHNKEGENIEKISNIILEMESNFILNQYIGAGLEEDCDRIR